MTLKMAFFPCFERLLVGVILQEPQSPRAKIALEVAIGPAPHRVSLVVLTEDPRPLSTRPLCLFYHKIGLCSPNWGRSEDEIGPQQTTIFLVRLNVWGWGPFPGQS